MVRLDHINKCFGDLHVLHDVFLEVAEGEKLGIIGPSGSGKSTSGHVYINVFVNCHVMLNSARFGMEGTAQFLMRLPIFVDNGLRLHHLVDRTVGSRQICC